MQGPNTASSEAACAERPWASSNLQTNICIGVKPIWHLKVDLFKE